jgi:Rieske Fe-S protein
VVGLSHIERGEKTVSQERRTALKIITSISFIVSLGSLASLLKSISPVVLEIPEWPRVRLANINGIKLRTWYLFSYPTKDIPCLLVKTGKSLPSGVGPDRDIIAYVMICQHARYYGTIYIPPKEVRDPEKLTYLKTVPPNILELYPDKNLLYCPAHAGIYDLEKDGEVLAGPPFCSLCKVVLEYDEASGDIYAVGLSPPAPAVPGVTQCSNNPEELKRIMLGKKLVTEASLEEKI